MLQAPTRAAATASLSRGLGAVLLLVVALGFLPGQSTVPPLDRDEPRYTQATKQMVETGDYVTINFQEAARNKKPIGIHWLQAGAVALSGQGAAAPLWIYRVPSVLGALAAMLLSVWAARAFLPTGPAVVTGALIGATIILGVESRLAKTDAVLLATVVASQGALARVWLERAKTLAMPALFWFALALGILVKGPVPLMVAALTVATLAILSDRSILARIRPLMGLGIVALVCLPWFVAIWIETDGAFFMNALGRDFLGKAATGQEGHGAPPLTHLGVFFAVGWPLAPLALAAVALWLKQRSPALLFAAAWAIPSWIVFEAIPTKLPHYTLPLLPGIALAAVAALSAGTPPRWLRIVAAVLLVAVPLAASGAALVIPYGLDLAMERPAEVVAIVFAQAVPLGLGLLSAAIVALGAVAFARGTPVVAARVAVPVVVGAVLAQVAVWGVFLPRLDTVWISPRLVAAADAAAGCPNPRLISIGFREPSMIFLAGTDTMLTSPPAALETAAATPCSVVAVEAESLADFTAAAGDTMREAGTVDGFNISKGDPVHLSLFVAANR